MNARNGWFLSMVLIAALLAWIIATADPDCPGEVRQNSKTMVCDDHR